MSERQAVSDLVKDVNVPKMFEVEQLFRQDKIEVENIPEVILNLLSEEKFACQIKPGMRIAITAGSRGVSNVALITKTIVDFVKDKKGNPFVVPSMGSHGGATAEGQKEVLEEYGIKEEYIGCPIISSMEVVEIGKNDEGKSVYIDKNAANADGIILSCRIKPHTAFRGPYESGLMKMMAIGLGKQYGAEVIHAEGFKNMAKNVPLYGKAILKNAPIMFGVAVIENAFDETCKIVALNSDEIEREEPKLLKEAFKSMPKICIDECDVLIVDQIGKNFSGDGMDPNITGTFCSPYATGGIKAQRVAVLDISPESHGNGIGLGYSSATTKRVFSKLELTSMYLNAITCTVLGGVRIPIVMESDKEAIQVCIKTCNEIDKKNPRIVRISNSLHLKRILLSESYYDDLKRNPNLIIKTEPKEMRFNSNGDLW